MIATVLATVALIMRAGVVGLPVGSALGLPILLQALAAAVIGRMEKLSVIFLASVGLVIAYRRFFQHRGITGPSARSLPRRRL